MRLRSGYPLAWKLSGDVDATEYAAATGDEDCHRQLCIGGNVGRSPDCNRQTVLRRVPSDLTLITRLVEVDYRIRRRYEIVRVSRGSNELRASCMCRGNNRGQCQWAEVLGYPGLRAMLRVLQGPMKVESIVSVELSSFCGGSQRSLPTGGFQFGESMLGLSLCWMPSCETLSCQL